VSIRKSLKQMGTIIFFGFLLYNDRLFEWYKGLPWQITYGAVGVVGLIVGITVYIARHWPEKVRPHRELILSGLGQIRFAIFAFLFVGFGDVFLKLDQFLISFYMYPGVWITFGLQGLLLLQVVGLQYPQANVMGNAMARGVRYLWNRLKKRRDTVRFISKSRLPRSQQSMLNLIHQIPVQDNELSKKGQRNEYDSSS
jgi:hypothetical protein